MLKRFTIRSLLTLIIGALGILLVGLSVNGLVSSVGRNSDATRIVSLTGASQHLFSALLGFRLERGIVNPGLMADATADANLESRVAALRKESEDGYQAAMQRFTAVADPEVLPLLDRLKASHDMLNGLRSRTDAALRQTKSSRDTALVSDYVKSAQVYLDDILLLSNAVEASLKLVDPMVDHLLSIKQSAWATRNYAGSVAGRMESAAATAKPWEQKDIIGAAEDRGRADLAWQQVLDATSRADTPSGLRDVVARSKDATAASLRTQQQAVVSDLSSGVKTALSVADIQKINTASNAYSVNVGHAALAEMVGRAERQADASARNVLLNSLMLAMALIVAIAGFIIVGRRVTGPILSMTGAMRRLADHDMATIIPGVGRSDEIGAMASAVQVFKENMIKAAEAQEREQADQLARERRTAAIEDLTGGFDKAAASVLASVATAASQMKVTAESMQSTVEETSRRATIVASAAEEASTNVQTVASAAEELTSSITEISRQVTESTVISRDAVEQVQATIARIESLSDAAQKVGDVVKLVNDIASQTNLLALNATIEAARAGEAGKGFAVVASEVKSLANQTAKATEEIAAQIANIQNATADTVSSVQGIGSTISRVDEIATTIASAVEEQGAATREIARNVQQAATGAREVTTNIAGVDRASAETGVAATQVLGAAGELSQKSEILSGEVESFLARIKAV